MSQPSFPFNLHKWIDHEIPESMEPEVFRVLVGSIVSQLMTCRGKRAEGFGRLLPKLYPRVKSLRRAVKGDTPIRNARKQMLKDAGLLDTLKTILDGCDGREATVDDGRRVWPSIEKQVLALQPQQLRVKVVPGFLEDPPFPGALPRGQKEAPAAPHSLPAPPASPQPSKKKSSMKTSAQQHTTGADQPVAGSSRTTQDSGVKPRATTSEDKSRKPKKPDARAGAGPAADMGKTTLVPKAMHPGISPADLLAGKHQLSEDMDVDNAIPLEKYKEELNEEQERQRLKALQKGKTTTPRIIKPAQPEPPAPGEQSGSEYHPEGEDVGADPPTNTKTPRVKQEGSKKRTVVVYAADSTLEPYDRQPAADYKPILVPAERRCTNCILHNARCMWVRKQKTRVEDTSCFYCHESKHKCSLSKPKRPAGTAPTPKPPSKKAKKPRKSAAVVEEADDEPADNEPAGVDNAGNTGAGQHTTPADDNMTVDDPAPVAATQDEAPRTGAKRKQFAYVEIPVRDTKRVRIEGDDQGKSIATLVTDAGNPLASSIELARALDKMREAQKQHNKNVKTQLEVHGEVFDEHHKDIVQLYGQLQTSQGASDAKYVLVEKLATEALVAKSKMESRIECLEAENRRLNLVISRLQTDFEAMGQFLAQHHRNSQQVSSTPAPVATPPQQHAPAAVASHSAQPASDTVQRSSLEHSGTGQVDGDAHGAAAGVQPDINPPSTPRPLSSARQQSTPTNSPSPQSPGEVHGESVEGQLPAGVDREGDSVMEESQHDDEFGGNTRSPTRQTVASLAEVEAREGSSESELEDMDLDSSLIVPPAGGDIGDVPLTQVGPVTASDPADITTPANITNPANSTDPTSAAASALPASSAAPATPSSPAVPIAPVVPAASTAPAAPAVPTGPAGPAATNTSADLQSGGPAQPEDLDTAAAQGSTLPPAKPRGTNIQRRSRAIVVGPYTKSPLRTRSRPRTDGDGTA